MKSLSVLLRNLTLAALFAVAPLSAAPLSAAELTAAVAANFTGAFNQLAPLFEQRTGHRIKASFGSSGRLYAQITHGAPFEVFLSADDTRARQLIDAGFAVPGSDFVYASGRLVLWSKMPGLVDAQGRVLTTGNFKRLAIANPKAAPYGAAAKEVMQAMGLYDPLESKLVQGESIAQAQQFVFSGNAELGFVAYSQIMSLKRDERGSFWLVPESMHRPIAQLAVLTKRGEDNQAARAFLAFLKSPEAVSLMHDFGYSTEP